MVLALLSHSGCRVSMPTMGTPPWRRAPHRLPWKANPWRAWLAWGSWFTGQSLGSHEARVTLEDNEGCVSVLAVPPGAPFATPSPPNPPRYLLALGPHHADLSRPALDKSEDEGEGEGSCGQTPLPWEMPRGCPALLTSRPGRPGLPCSPPSPLSPFWPCRTDRCHPRCHPS